MPRVVPFPGEEVPTTGGSKPDTRVAGRRVPDHLLQEAFGSITVVHDPIPKDPIPGLIAFAKSAIAYRKRHNLTVPRFFVVACGACPEFYLVSAGPRGGSWKGRCRTCGMPSTGKEKAVVVTEVTDEDET